MLELKSRKVLLIEDDLEISKLMNKFLTRIFDTVHIAYDGKEGLSQYEEFRPDIIICDIEMPKMNGLDLIKTIRYEDKETRIIIISAYSDQDKLLKAIPLGLDEYFVKPIDFKKLKKVLLLSNEKISQKDFVCLIDDFSFNLDSRLLMDKDKNQIKLNKNEIDFLTFLCENRNVYLSKYEIAEHIYNNKNKVNNVRTLVSRFNAKVDANIIESVVDVGYRVRIL